MTLSPVWRQSLAAVLRPAAVAGVLFLGSAHPAQAADQLLFCNRPERIRTGGAHADARLKAGPSYRIFYHYRNGTRESGPLVVAFHGATSEPLTLITRKGIADPNVSPSQAGRQAMARFLKAPEKQYTGQRAVRFTSTLKRHEVASGVLTVTAVGQDARLRIYYRHNRHTVAGARVIAVDAPRRDYAIVLKPGSSRQYFRIGVPEPGMSKHLDGTYGLIYSFRVKAPPGRKVRVAFSPRGGKAGLVGTVSGMMRQTRIVGATAWSVFSETVVGKNGLVITTLPFGGVFYPVELAFQLR